MSITLRHDQIPVSDGILHIAHSGPRDADPVVFLHGWPQDWSAWSGVMESAGDSARCIAVDLPGIGQSRLNAPRGDKAYLAGLIHELIQTLELRNVTLVGHDAGGMVAYAYLRRFADAARAVIMDTVIPGVPPWESVLANPYVWHFAFHAIRELPEKLVRNDIPAYFDYFYDAISADPDAISREARARYVDAYSAASALQQGFELYRALRTDATDNARSTEPMTTPLLYLRGTEEGGEIGTYADGLRGAGVQNLSTALIDGAGHFAPEERPDPVWKQIAAHRDAARNG
jgi:pimeloyl-ACP methyl ester carboxylesterase